MAMDGKAWDFSVLWFLSPFSRSEGVLTESGGQSTACLAHNLLGSVLFSSEDFQVKGGMAVHSLTFV
jgi:hypothetical protein